MPRLLLIAALFIQLLVAQVAVADTFCVHALSGHDSADAAHAAAPHADAGSHEQSHGDFSCDVSGHCSGNVIGSVMYTAGHDLPLHTDNPAMVTDAIARGYRTHPYRPPSAAA